MSAPRLWLRLFAIFSVLSFLIAACGGAPAAQPTSAPAAQPSAAPAAQPAAPAAQEPIELVVWADGAIINAMESEPNGKGRYANYLKQTFEKEHPGVTVKLEDHGWDETLRQNLTNALLAGTAPDVIVGEGFFQNYAALGALVPLDDKIADVKANLIPGTYKGALYQDKIYGLSGYTGVFGFERNCLVIKEAGLDCDKPPQTWDDLLSEAQAITDKGKGQFYGYTLQGPAGFSIGAPFRLAVYLAQAGAVICKDDCSTPYFNDPKAVPVYEFIRKINRYTPPGLTFEPDEGKLYTQLFLGKSAFQIAGSWHVGWAKENKCADCRYSAIPIPPGGKPTSVVVANVIYGVLKQSKHPDLAAEFIKLTTRDDVQDLVFASTGRLPSTRSALTKLRPTADPATQSYIDVLLNSSDLNAMPQWKKNPQQVWTVYNDFLTKLLTTDAPVQQLVDEAQQAADEAVK